VKKEAYFWDPLQTFSELTIEGAYNLWLFPERSHSSANKKQPSWSTEGNHFCVIPNNCSRQSWVFKQLGLFGSPLI